MYVLKGHGGIRTTQFLDCTVSCRGPLVRSMLGDIAGHVINLAAQRQPTICLHVVRCHRADRDDIRRFTGHLAGESLDLLPQKGIKRCWFRLPT